MGDDEVCYIWLRIDMVVNHKGAGFLQVFKMRISVGRITARPPVARKFSECDDRYVQLPGNKLQLPGYG